MSIVKQFQHGFWKGLSAHEYFILLDTAIGIGQHQVLSEAYISQFAIIARF